LLGIHYFSRLVDVEKRLIKTALYGTNFVLFEEIKKGCHGEIGGQICGKKLLRIIPLLYFPAPARLSSIRLVSRSGTATAVALITARHVAS
jgi:hypothetical protein